MALRAAITPSYIREVTIDPASIAATTVVDQTFTVSGLRTDMFVVVAMASLEANVTFCNAHVSANNTLKIRFRNRTAGAIDPASQTAKIIAF